MDSTIFFTLIEDNLKFLLEKQENSGAFLELLREKLE